MNNQSAISAKDIFERLVDGNIFTVTMTLDQVLAIVVSLLASVLAGLIIYFIYKKFFRGAVFSQTFAVTLIGMTVLTCMITLAISTNLVLSLGMVGALSIVRYRTAIKEPMDLLFMFWAIAAGITIGAYMYVLVAAASLLLILILLLMGRGGSRQIYVMIVHYRGDDIGDQIKRILNKTRHSVKSRTMRGDACEMAVEVYTKKGNLAFLEQVRSLESVDDVTLVQYNGEYHG